jgi:threonylcarbamoyladenosine tRNA methylthiotransferase MtaB
MVGFAGETQEDFETSLSFMEEIAFEKVHVFPYSIRKGTRAEKLEGHLDKKIKEERCKIMIEKAEEIRRRFFAEQIGRTYGIIIESQTDDGYCTGHTANYIPVKAKLPDVTNGSLVNVKITDVSDEDYLIGEII